MTALSTTTPSTTASATTASATTASATTASAASPVDLGDRLADLIRSVRTPDDFSAERIAALTGLPVGVDPEDSHRYGVGIRLDDAWACNLATIPDRKGGPPKRFVFSYDDIGQHRAHPVPASAPEFEDFARTLRDAGYEQSAIDGPRGALYGHRFIRDGVEVDVHTEREDPKAADIRFRVARVVVDAGAAMEVRHG
jgi:hypothetical protein